MAKKDPNTLWEDVREWLTDATRSAVKEAEDLTRRGKLKMEIMSLSYKIEKKLAELGGLVYDRLAETPDVLTVDAEIQRLQESIGRLEAERNQKRQQYEAVKKG